MEDLVNQFNWKLNGSEIEVGGSSKKNVQSKRNLFHRRFGRPIQFKTRS